MRQAQRGALVSIGYPRVPEEKKFNKKAEEAYPAFDMLPQLFCSLYHHPACLVMLMLSQLEASSAHCRQSLENHLLHP